MTIEQILIEKEVETQTILYENIEKKKNLYFIKDAKGDVLDGTNKEGYKSLENAIKDMFLVKTNNKFKKLTFKKQEEKIKRYIDMWKKKCDSKEPKPKKKFGFTEIK
jgi:hypothetical protein